MGLGNKDIGTIAAFACCLKGNKICLLGTTIRPQSRYMKIEKQIWAAIGPDRPSLETNLAEFQVIRIPVGTFAGTVVRLFLTKSGPTEGLDTGNQGGGQN